MFTIPESGLLNHVPNGAEKRMRASLLESIILIPLSDFQTFQFVIRFACRPNAARPLPQSTPPMEIEWRSSVPASAFYAALALLRGRTLVEPCVNLRSVRS